MRRRADSPSGPVTQERLRRGSASPSLSPTDSSGTRFMQRPAPNPSGTSPRIIRGSSPTRPILPPLHPLQLGGTEGNPPGPGPSSSSSYQSFSAAGNAASSGAPPRPGSWAPNWPPGHMTRHSMGGPAGVKSPSPSASPDRGRAEEPRTAGEPPTTTGPDIVFTRDVTNRQPRSMMACMRCRRQKMKCDGPGKEPCRGCRQAGVSCVFESRTRPKSISTIPSRASPFFPPPAEPAGPSFYPATSQAAPPVTTRPQLIPDYAIRQAQGVREHPAQMRPPPPAGMGTPYPPPLRAHTPPAHTPPTSAGGPQQYYPVGHPGYGHPPPGGPVPPQQSPSQLIDHRIEGRLRGLESAFRSVSTLPASVSGIEATLGAILRAQSALAAQVSGGGTAVPAAAIPPRNPTDVPDHVWESYRVGAWPLTPWLPGISPFPGLPSLVLMCMGRRAALERPEASRRESDAAAEAVVAEVSRLLAGRVLWTRDEVLALGVYSTWTNDSALGCLAVGLARDLQLDRVPIQRRGHEEWREWIYVVLADHLLHLPDFNLPIVQEPLANSWRDLIATSPPTESSVRDRDNRLLAWLQYSELLMEGSDYSEGRPGSHARGDSSGGRETARDQRDRRRVRDVYKRFASRWEAWAQSCGARHEPVLNLHYNYAVLFTASPVFVTNDRVWSLLTQSAEGHAQLERGRDAAFNVLAGLGAPEINRSFVFSLPVFRPFFGLAIAHLVGLTSALSHTPIINLSHVQQVLHTAAYHLSPAQASDGGPAHPASPSGARSRGGPAPSLLQEMADTGAIIQIGKREIVGAEPGRDLWRRIVG
ncbi:hypothetical protein VHUM_00316 [Vanrija humicola]|uniref:Zn(2)-C6 fungal-type domain-containing protein n=1 Tax=Vanrija humicola TaxID=5417 RepID=A0A7D8V3I4_VANHU|nr:hypothetical protein VHUM_00316 [Vanrija humicola]